MMQLYDKLDSNPCGITKCYYVGLHGCTGKRYRLRAIAALFAATGYAKADSC
ncbi:hypothetical protein GCM10020370_54970 [Paenibacillus hodogayensis]